jgi:hypothetical protein
MSASLRKRPKCCVAAKRRYVPLLLQKYFEHPSANRRTLWEDSITGAPSGPAINITRALGARIGVSEVIPVEHTNPAAVVACVKTGGCDLGSFKG